MRIAPVIAMFALIGIFRLFGYFTDPRADSQDIRRIIGEPARVTGPAEAGDLRVVTWNSQYGARFNRVVDELHHLDADVYLLQEVDVFCRRSGNRNVAKDLADAIGANWVFAGEFQEIGESTNPVPALTGQAILSKYPITSVTYVPCSSPESRLGGPACVRPVTALCQKPRVCQRLQQGAGRLVIDVP